ncbi:MAG: STAS domain-containing protein [bacterium]
MVRINIRRGRITLISLSGEIGSDETGVFRDTLQDILKLQSLNVIVDLSQVTYISSDGLGLLVYWLKSIRGRGGEMKLAAINPRIFDMFSVTRVMELFEVYKTVQEAKDSFR